MHMHVQKTTRNNVPRVCPPDFLQTRFLTSMELGKQAMVTDQGAGATRFFPSTRSTYVNTTPTQAFSVGFGDKPHVYLFARQDLYQVSYLTRPRCLICVFLPRQSVWGGIYMSIPAWGASLSPFPLFLIYNDVVNVTATPYNRELTKVELVRKSTSPASQHESHKLCSAAAMAEASAEGHHHRGFERSLHTL